MKTKILFIMHMPPPVHGAAMMGQYIHDSKLINETFECIYINPSASQSVAEVGKISLRKIGFLFSNLITIIKTVIREKPDLCYLTPSAWDFGFYRDWFTIEILKLIGCNIIVHFHNKGIKSFEKKWYNKLLYKSFFRNIKAIFLAENLINEFRNYLKPQYTFICPNGIKPTLNGPYIRKHTHSPYRFLFLSNMMLEKGVYILLEACSVIKGKGFNFTCDFIGKWSDITEEAFNYKVNELNLNDSVTAYGAKYGDAKKHFFENADALVFPTYYHGETFGLVLLEAMEYALPCISTKEGGIPSVLKNRETGWIIPPQNISELVDRMIRFIQNPNEGLRMGEKGNREFLKEYTITSFEKKMHNILKQSIHS